MTAARLDFGNTLSELALAPTYRAFECFREVRVPQGLAEVSHENLLAALTSAVAVTAKRLGLKPRDVEAILPWAGYMGQLQQLERARVEAQSVFDQYAVSVGGLLTGLAGATMEVDPKRKSAAQTLTNVARRFSRERALVGPLKVLAAELEAWEEAMEKAGELIDRSRLVHRHLQRRQLFRVSLVFLIFAICSVAGAFMIRERRIAAARQKLDARITAATDPCAITDIDEEEKRHALPEHFARIDEKKKVCEERRARERYEASCDALAKAVESGKLSAEDKATAKGAAEKLERAAEGKLVVADLLAKESEMPCGDTKAKGRIWLAYARGAARSTAAWADVPEISEDLKKALASKELEKETAYKEGIAPDAEEVASRAIKGDAVAMERAEKLCNGRAAYGLEVGKKCQRFLQILEGLAKQKKK
ncbi:hypothetical protein [Polyangium mundeleinium]|uniref:Uncharacterized protein n=1 Tax=Polyangium mundeleinium TaxID=2995306 RepID=A0ABT5F4I0_9BACT|nr:hypothetical protein [Polyangium mundeleinium]MDC0748047.1 hypothetical protein [Polyangium mundeleinium]